MSTRTEHIARLTEMAVRAQEAADWLASQDDPTFDELIAANREGMQEDYDRNTRHDREVARLRGELRDAERERGDANRMCNLSDAGRKARTAQRDTFHKHLAAATAALGKPEGAAYADLPRLVRELRDERDTLRRQRRVRAQEQARELADLKARAVVLPENWREQIFDVTDNAEVEDKWQGVTSLIGSWRAERVPRELRGEV